MAISPRHVASKQGWVLGLASVASFMISLDSLVVATALTTIRHDLHSSLESLEWTVNAYNLSFAALLLTGAALGDRLGRKRMFGFGLVLFAIASAACAVSPSIGWLITSRAVQGAGAALVMPLALTLVSAAFPPAQRGRALGIFAGVTGLATFSGPFIGGAVAEGLTWEWIFWVNVPIALIAIVLVRGRIEESFGPDNRLDLPGLGLATGGALGLVWGLVRGNAVGWGSLEAAGALAAGALLILAFIGWEVRASAPMLPMRFFRLPAFSTANLANFGLFGSLYGTVFFLAQYLQTAQGQGAFVAGLRLMPWTATLMVCAPIAGRLADKLGERWFVAGGLALQTLGMGWIALIAAPGLPYFQLLPALITGGCGLSMALPAAQKAVIGAVPVAEIGKASGAATSLRILGGAFGIAILAAVFAEAGSYASPQEFTNGFAPAMGAAASIALVGALAGLGIPGRRSAYAAPATAPVPVRQANSGNRNGRGTGSPSAAITSNQET